MGIGVVYRAIDPIGVKGTDGAAVASPANPLDVQVQGIIPGTAATSLGKAEDAAHASSDTGILSLHVRKDDPVAGPDATNADGDYSQASVDSKGRAWGRVFIVHDDGSIVKAKAQQASGASFPVVVSTEQEAILSATKAAVEVMDDWDEGDRAKVNTIAGQSGVAAGSGPVSANTQRVHLTDENLSSIRGLSAKTLTDLWNVLQNQREVSESLWTDDAGGYYLRRIVIDESATPPTFTVSWTDKDGNSSAGPGAGARPVSSLDREVVEQRFIATAGGTGYSIGDYLARVLVIDASQTPPAIDAAIWVNISTGVSISAPTVGTFEESTEIVGIKGKDGATIASDANAVPVAPIPGQTGVAAGSGATSAATQRVVAATDSPEVASLGVMDDWDQNDRAKTSPIVGQDGVEAGSGVTTAKTQRVVVATDQPSISTTSTIVTAALQPGVQTTVDGTAGGVLLYTFDANAKEVTIQNVGSATMRTGPSGVTATTGLQIVAGGHKTWAVPGPMPSNNVYGIREGAISTTALLQKMN